MAAAACVCVAAGCPVVVGGSAVAVDAPAAAVATVTEAALAAVSQALSAAPDADVPPPDGDGTDAPDADGCDATAAGAWRSTSLASAGLLETHRHESVWCSAAGRGSYQQTCHGSMSSGSPDWSRFLLWTVKSTRNMCYCQTLWLWRTGVSKQEEEPHRKEEEHADETKTKNEYDRTVFPHIRPSLCSLFTTRVTIMCLCL